MIQNLSEKYSRHAACLLFFVFYLSIAAPLYAMRRDEWKKQQSILTEISNRMATYRLGEVRGSGRDKKGARVIGMPDQVAIDKNPDLTNPAEAFDEDKADIGGPSQPEMSSFKSASVDDMVNLFTGDFSYNIPLLDVGGYPVNIFYNGGVSLEQEASWVGLGWNINPGTVSRNTRGVPDDFNGEDKLKQTQAMKPNITWGGRLGADLEWAGIKTKLPDNLDLNLEAGLGFSINNYLGPSLELSAKGGVSITLGNNADHEKSAKVTPKVNAGVGGNLSSRYGLTLTTNVSMSASMALKSGSLTAGSGLSTSYNSRSGIQALNISSQMFYNTKAAAEGANSSSYGNTIYGTSISFTKPSYVPDIRMPVTNASHAGRFQLGSGNWGVFGSGEVEVYKQKSYISPEDSVQYKSMVGYLYFEKAGKREDVVLDFSRLNDREVTPNTTIISAPQYAYDVFSISGEGTGGSVRLYRNDHGYVHDVRTQSRDNSATGGIDIGLPGHIGANFSHIKTPSTVGVWKAGNKLRNVLAFQEPDKTWENVYFRNPGETTVLHDDQFNQVGGTDLVRFKLGGDDVNPTVEPVLEKFSKVLQKTGTVDFANANFQRSKRSQVINFLNAKDASITGLDVYIRNYSRSTLIDSDTLKYTALPRIDDLRKPHHISQIDITETDGKRYIYGLPVYNHKQIDLTFTVGDETEDERGYVSFQEGDTKVTSAHLAVNSDRDGYLQVTETPPHAHSFLLTGLLSPDYVDVTGDGITDDDYGNAVKFNYSKEAQLSRWRTPLTPDRQANANMGHLSQNRDDKGMISYGERESWYLHSIESKTMIAFFHVGNRHDAKGATNPLSGINTNDQSAKKLEKIELFSKADLKKNGYNGATPIKTVWFDYDYSLCKDAPGNDGSSETGNENKGKLTLKSISFSFNGQGKTRAQKNRYRFNYADNKDYMAASSDRWGNYKPASQNPKYNGNTALKNSEFPYSIQDDGTPDHAHINSNAAAWLLNEIMLPTGGKINVAYESDDYAFVQNKRAAAMVKVAGIGYEQNPMNNALYEVDGSGKIIEKDIVYVSVSEACETKEDVYAKYLVGITQLCFKLAVRMPKEFEFITCYAEITDWGVHDENTIWIKIAMVDGISPMSLAAFEYLREQLPGQLYPGYEVNDGTTLKQIGRMMEGFISSISNAFGNPLHQFRQQGVARLIDTDRSFVRLNVPSGRKFGGGHRVKSVQLSDRWNEMIQQFESVYGKNYVYTRTEIFNGSERTISSGVASYEPSIGGEENPFQTIVRVSNSLPMGPTSYGAIEMPVLDGFFPAPVIGYSKVTVQSIKKGQLPQGALKARSGVGRQVTEFYTAKDFPVYYQYTPFDDASRKEKHEASLTKFFEKWAFDSKALSQGFLIVTNDMHGKLWKQTSYADNDESTPVHYTENFYRNTGKLGLEDKFQFIHGLEGGIIREGNMGIDIELMTDLREFTVRTASEDVQAQGEMFVPVFPWIPFIWPVYGSSENVYRAVTTTKVISYHSVLDSVLVMDKGSMVSTKNLYYDAETGNVLVSRTNNEYNHSIYTTNYPAYWAYSGMGPAYRNMGALLRNLKFVDGRIVSGLAQNEIKEIIESGDELQIIHIDGNATLPGCGVTFESSDAIKVIWAFDTNKNNSSLTNNNPDFVFMDKSGKIYNKAGVTARIIRSGKRNMLNAMVGSVSSRTIPVPDPENPYLRITNATQVLQASALSFREKWHIDRDIIRKVKITYDQFTCEYSEVDDCNAEFEKYINPYRKGLIGNFRADTSWMFYGSRAQSSVAQPTNLPTDGDLADFHLYWDFTGNSLVPKQGSTKWVWNNRVTRYNAKGMELETNNALGIYTAAQYGYHKSLPIAITNNARYQEAVYTGFEDDSYDEFLNGSIGQNCSWQTHFAFDKQAIVSASSEGIRAHSGKSVLKVAAGSSMVKTVPVAAPVSEDLPVLLEPASLLQLSTLGGTFEKESPSIPSNAPKIEPEFDVTHGAPFGMTLTFASDKEFTDGELIEGGKLRYYLNYKVTQYTEITTPGTYTFSLWSNLYTSENIFSFDTKQAKLQVIVKDIADDTKLMAEIEYDPANPYTLQAPVFLTCGIYKIESFCVVDAIKDPGLYGAFQNLTASFMLTTNTNSYSYETPDTETACQYTKPLAGIEQMLKPVFTATRGKQMLFSAWVREKAGNVLTYEKSKVLIQFNQGASGCENLRPTGPIIEGWQKVECNFTVPANATSMTLTFVNEDPINPIYLDDIRIHPFNANMQTYVYDPVNLRLVAEQDANNYSKFYEYDEEGGLIRTKVETKTGIRTIQETRSARQKKF